MVKAPPRGLGEISKKDKIFESAMSLFRKKGFDATTIRDIASHAGVALGSTHYTFGSKEELVVHFFKTLLISQQKRGEEIIAETRSFSIRINKYFEFIFNQLKADREIIRALARVTGDPSSPASSLSWQTEDIRSQSVEILSELVKGSDLKIHPLLRPHAGELLWLTLMGMAFFWSHDRTPNQRCANAITSTTLTLIPGVFRLTTIPLATRYVKLILKIVQEAFEAFSYKEEDNSENSATKHRVCDLD